MPLKLITPAAAAVVNLTRAKLHCRVDGADEDALVADMVGAATAMLEAQTGRAFAAQTWELSLDAFADAIRLDIGPVQSVTSVKYTDLDGNEQTVDPAIWQTDLVSDPAWVLRVSDAVWPSAMATANAVRVRFVAGYAETPLPLCQAVLLLAGHWYANREAAGAGNMAELPLGVDHLITNYRSWLW